MPRTTRRRAGRGMAGKAAKDEIQGVSSSEPSDCCGQLHCGEEVPGGLVVAGRDGTELFDRGEKIRAEVARFVGAFVKTSGRPQPCCLSSRIHCRRLQRDAEMPFAIRQILPNDRTADARVHHRRNAPADPARERLRGSETEPPDEQLAILCRDTHRPASPRQKVSDPVPLVVTKGVAAHLSAPVWLASHESEFAPLRNPLFDATSQQALLFEKGEGKTFCTLASPSWRLRMVQFLFYVVSDHHDTASTARCAPLHRSGGDRN